MHDALGLRRTTEDDIQSANLMALIKLEPYLAATVSAQEKAGAGREVIQMRDVYLENDPVFRLILGRPYRLRISLRHQQRRQTSCYKTVHIKVKPSDGPWTELKIEESHVLSGNSEATAVFQPEVLKSEKLKSAGPSFGMPDQKYVAVQIDIGVQVEAIEDSPQDLKLSGQLLFYMVAPESETNKTQVRQFVRETGSSWEALPKWIKNESNGAIILARSDVQTLVKESSEHLSIFSRLFSRV